MRVLIAAGGTAGHINPALAIAGAIKKADPSAEIHFAGRREGMEYPGNNPDPFGLGHRR